MVEYTGKYKPCGCVISSDQTVNDIYHTFAAAQCRILSNNSGVLSMLPHLAYMSTRELATITSANNPFSAMLWYMLVACWRSFISAPAVIMLARVVKFWHYASQLHFLETSQAFSKRPFCSYHSVQSWDHLRISEKKPSSLKIV